VQSGTTKIKSPLDNISGQKRVKNILNNFLYSNSIPHAFLFSGIEGIGKENAVIQFAKSSIINNNSQDAEKAERFVELLQEPYVKLIFPLPRGKNETDSSSPTEKLTLEELELVREQINLKADNPFHKISIPKANSIKINSIRDIKRFLSLQYDEISYRFVIIIDAHLMNDEAQNALLKSLEEPPEKVIFFLTTSSVNRLRPTILSRCWRINFDPLKEDEIVFILKKYFNIDELSATETAPFAMGSVQTALNLIDLDIQNLKEKTVSILRYSFGRKFDSAFNELNSVLTESNSEIFPIVISMIITWLNDIQKHKLKISNYFFKDHTETLEKFNNKFPDVNLSNLASRLDNLSRLPRNNINPSLLSANLIFELSSVVLIK
jgi:DNA polymerase-3 subunit delta'